MAAPIPQLPPTKKRLAEPADVRHMCMGYVVSIPVAGSTSCSCSKHISSGTYEYGSGRWRNESHTRESEW